MPLSLSLSLSLSVTMLPPQVTVALREGAEQLQKHYTPMKQASSLDKGGEKNAYNHAAMSLTHCGFWWSSETAAREKGGRAARVLGEMLFMLDPHWRTIGAAGHTSIFSDLQGLGLKYLPSTLNDGTFKAYSPTQVSRTLS